MFNRIYETKQSLLSITTHIVVKLMNQAEKIITSREEKRDLDSWGQMSEITRF